MIKQLWVEKANRLEQDNESLKKELSYFRSKHEFLLRAHSGLEKAHRKMELSMNRMQGYLDRVHEQDVERGAVRDIPATVEEGMADLTIEPINRGAIFAGPYDPGRPDNG